MLFAPFLVLGVLETILYFTTEHTDKKPRIQGFKGPRGQVSEIKVARGREPKRKGVLR